MANWKENCENSYLCLNWSIPLVDTLVRNITYCVNVINSTADTVLYSVPDIHETEHEFMLPNDSYCHITQFMVKVVNTTFQLTNDTLAFQADTTRELSHIVNYYTAELSLPLNF